MSPSSNGRAGSWRRAYVGAAPNRRAGSCWSWSRSRRSTPVAKDRRASDGFASACDGALCPHDPARARQASFFERDADAAEEAAHHCRVGPDPTLRQQPVAKRLKRDVGFLRSQRFEKLTMRLKPRTEVSAHLARRPRTASFEALHPLDGRGLAHPEARRSRPPAHPSPNYRVDHPVAQVLRICTGHPRWPPPSQQVESEQCQFGNPNRFKLDTACSRRLSAEGYLSACCGRECPAIADGGRRRGADRRWPARTGRRSAELAQRLPRPHARHAAWLAQSQDPEAAGRQLLPAVPGGAQDHGKGVGRRHPGGLDRRGGDPPGRRDRPGDGTLRHLEEPGLETVQGNRRAREGLPRTAARRRLALSVAGCDLPEGARGRTHRLGRRDNRCGRQHRRTARDRWARHWPVGSRDLLGGLPGKRLTRRGLRGVKLVISDAHEGLKAAVQRVVGATWQRCRVHFMRNALAYAPKTQETVVAAAIRQAFIQPDRETAGQVWRHVADQLRPRFEKLGRLMDEAEHDVLAYMTFAASLPGYAAFGLRLVPDHSDPLRPRYEHVDCESTCI